MTHKDWRMPKKGFDPNVEIRWAVVDHVHGEVFTQNHKVIGEAFNSIDEDYVNTKNLIVVATQNDRIIGEVRRNGVLKDNGRKLPETIWSGPRHVYFDPALAKKVTETGQEQITKLIADLREHGGFVC